MAYEPSKCYRQGCGVGGFEYRAGGGGGHSGLNYGYQLPNRRSERKR